MAAATQVFDRVDIIETIRSACLGERGESGVLVCSHKSGKSFLLDHIYATLGTPDLIFCWVNLDVLRAEQGAQAGPLDQTFLKQFLRRLSLGLKRWVEDHIDERDEAKAKLTALIARR